MSSTYLFRCTCGNQAKNLMTLSSGELIAKCGRCAPVRPNSAPSSGVPTVVPLINVALTDELAAKIRADTKEIADAKNREREQKSALRSKVEQYVSTYVPTEQAMEMEISFQPLVQPPPFFATRDAKWKHIPYYALHRIFEFLGEWGPSGVSKRWYDCFMNYDFKLSIPTNKLILAIWKCSQSITFEIPGWSNEHISFWKKLVTCHTETISLLTILSTVQTSSPYQSSYWYKRKFQEWVLYEIVRPCFVIRDKTLFNHLNGCFEEETWIRNTMKTEFSRIARTFIQLRRFPLFLREYGHLMTEFGITPKMLNEMEKLPEPETHTDA